MVIETIMICVDNSKWMRNDDYPPSRFGAQTDAVNRIFGAKTRSNRENTVGVSKMAGGVRVVVNPTVDVGKILPCMNGIEIGGESNLPAGILVAQLALGHLKNKNQQQRIIVFAGSPIKQDNISLELLGRTLKTNKVALDIINFGEDDEGKKEKLEALVAAVNTNNNSHIVHAPAGHTISGVLTSSPILSSDGEQSSAQDATVSEHSSEASSSHGLPETGTSDVKMAEVYKLLGSSDLADLSILDLCGDKKPDTGKSTKKEKK